MPSDKTQLSTWVSAEEAEKIRTAAEAERRSVSQWLLFAALEKLAQRPAT